MPNFICTTCGTQYAESDQPPAACTDCEDERQYVKATGQQWTALDKLRLTNRNSLKFKEPGLSGVGIEPHFAIGQRAMFLRTAKANVLWDCLSLLDEAVVEAVNAMGGISAIAISHPHYYSSDIIQMVPDRKHVSFMYSYPNYIPLPASAIERIVKAVEPFEYDRVYGAFWDMVIETGGKAVVKRSAERYLRAIEK